MRWVLQLVETGTDRRTRSVEVLEISRPSDLGAIASLGLTLAEAKQVLARVQQAVVATQAHDMQSCGRIARPAAGNNTSRTGGFIRSRHYSAGWPCGCRDFSALAVAASKRLSAGHRIVGRHRSWTSCERIFPP